MKYRYIIVRILILFNVTLGAQIKMGDNSDQINMNALLHLSSSEKGLLLPRIPDQNKIKYGAKEKGMLIFDRLSSSLYVWDGKAWILMGGSKFITGSSPQEAVYTTGVGVNTKVGIGIKDPMYTLHIDADANVATVDDNLIFFNIGQMVVGSNVVTPGALLNLATNDKGLLLPRVPLINLRGILNKEGMMVYDSSSKIVKYYDGNNWVDTSAMFTDGTDVIKGQDHAVFFRKVPDPKDPTKTKVDPTKTRVGIGLIEPETQLHVNGNIRADRLILPLPVNGTLEGKLLFSKDANGTVEWRDFPEVAFVHDPINKMSKVTYRSDKTTVRVGVERFVVTDDGKVGIGTVKPTKQLDVNGNMKVTKMFETENLRVIDGASTTTNDKVLTSDKDGNASWKPLSELPLVNDNKNNMITIPKTSDNVTGRTAKNSFVITDAGNLGLGNTAPTQKLEMNGEMKVEGRLHINQLKLQNGSEMAGLYLMCGVRDSIKDGQDANGKDKYKYLFGRAYWDKPQLTPFKFDPKSSRIVLNIDSQGDVRPEERSFVIKDDGKVGLGTHSPTEALEVSQNIRITGILKIGRGIREPGTIEISGGSPEQGKALISDVSGEGKWGSLPFRQNTANGSSHIPNKSDGKTGRKKDDGNFFEIKNDGKMGLGLLVPTFKIELSGGGTENQNYDYQRVIGIGEGVAEVYPVIYRPEPKKDKDNNMKQKDDDGAGNILFGSDWGASYFERGSSRRRVDEKEIEDIITKVGSYNSYNTAAGIGAMKFFSEGSNNVAIGNNAMTSNQGNGNVAIGYKAMELFGSGENNTVIGALSASSTSTMNNTTVIGGKVANLNNLDGQIVVANSFGDSSVMNINSSGSIKIGDIKETPRFVKGVAFEVISTTGGFRPTVVTPIDRKNMTIGTASAELAGLQVFDKELKLILVYDGTNWIEPGNYIGMRMWWAKRKNPNDPNDKTIADIPPGWEKVANSEGRFNLTSGQIAATKILDPNSSAPAGTLIDDPVSKRHTFDIGEIGGYTKFKTVAGGIIKQIDATNLPISLEMKHIPGHTHEMSEYSHNHDGNFLGYLAKSDKNTTTNVSALVRSGGGDLTNTGYGAVDFSDATNTHTHTASFSGGDATTKEGESKPHVHEIETRLPTYFVAGILVEYKGF